MPFPQITLAHRAVDPLNRNVDPGVDDPYFGRRMSGVRITTTMLGFGELAGNVGCSRAEAERLKRRRGHHLACFYKGVTMFEGRLSQIEQAVGGAAIRATGYGAALGDHGMHGTLPEGTDAGSIILQALRGGNQAPLVRDDFSLVVESTGLKVTATELDGSKSLLDVADDILSVSDDKSQRPFFLSVWDGRRVWLQGQEMATVGFTIPREAFTQIPRQAVHLDDEFTGVRVTYDAPGSGTTGQTQRVRTTSAMVVDHDRELALGFGRDTTVSGGKSITSEPQALAAARTELALLHGVQNFDLTVAGRVLNHVGARVEPCFIRAGHLVRVEFALPDSLTSPDDLYRLAYVDETEWDLSSGRVKLRCSPMVGTLLATEATLLGTSGLQRVA